MSDRARVSVVLPFRDAAATLDEAIGSLAAQSLTAFECILVDNGSTDASTARARAAIARDRRFRLIAVAGGLVRALNAGIATARSAVIARMDADDLAHPRRLELQLAALESDPSLSVVSCLVECFPTGMVRDGMRRYAQWLNGLLTATAIRDAMFVESPIAHPTAVIRRTALAAAGGYREIDGPEDYDLWLRLLVAGHRAAKVPATLLAWRESPQRLSRTDPRYHRRRFFATKLAHFPHAVPPHAAIDVCGAGPTGRRWARALATSGYRVRRFIDVAPWRWGTAVGGIPICDPEAADFEGGFALAAAGTPGAREQIEAWLRSRGLQPWRDFLAVA